MIVNKQEYYYKKLLKSANNNADKTVEISDKAAEELGLKEVEVNPDIPQDPIEPELPNDPEDVDWSKEYLTFEALEDGTFSFTYNDLYYSINNGKSWISLAAGTQTQLIPARTKVLWKGDNILKTNAGFENGNIGHFSSTGKFNVMGNILSLIYKDFNTRTAGTGSEKDNLRYLFYNCNNLISAEYLVLPIIDLSTMSPYNYGNYGVYAYMFSDCTLLKIAPKLLAAKLSSNCYTYMFHNCTSLETAPDLLVKKLVSECYKLMFDGCTNLKYIKMMATDISATDCLIGWIGNNSSSQSVSSTGTFVKSKDLVFDNIGSSGIPAGWEIIEE